MRYSELFENSILSEAKEVWYHGSNTVITEFTLDHLSSGQGADQEGPGIYLTSNATDAKKYGKYIHVITANVTKSKLMSDTKKTLEYGITRLIKNSPDKEMALTNWDENPNRAFNKALDSILSSYPIYRDALEATWADFYMDHPQDYLKQLTRFGYIGFKLVRTPDTSHFICWDPGILNITSLIA